MGEKGQHKKRGQASLRTRQPSFSNSKLQSVRVPFCLLQLLWLLVASFLLLQFLTAGALARATTKKYFERGKSIEAEENNTEENSGRQAQTSIPDRQEQRKRHLLPVPNHSKHVHPCTRTHTLLKPRYTSILHAGLPLHLPLRICIDEER